MPGGSLSRAQGSTPDLAGVPDRAGSVVRDQIAAMIEAARDSAAEITRHARDAGSETRAGGSEAAARVSAQIDAIEHELTDLLRNVAQEADGLRAELDRARLASAFRPPSGRETAGREAVALDPGLTEAIGPAGADSLPARAEIEQAPAEPETNGPSNEADEGLSGGPLDPEVEATDDEPSPTGDRPPDAPSDGIEEAAPEVLNQPPEEEEGLSAASASDSGHEPAEVGPEEAEDAGAADAPEEPATSLYPTEDLGTLPDKTDLALAELHKLAAANAADAEDEVTAEHWREVGRAVVEEAAGRAQFGRLGPNESVGGRKAKTRRARILRPLREAREEALEKAQIEDPESESTPEGRLDGESKPASDVGDTESEAVADYEEQEVVAESEEQEVVAESEEQEVVADYEEQEAVADYEEQEAVADDEEQEAAAESEPDEPKRRLLSRLSGGRRRKGPFITTPGYCAVCRKAFQVESEEELSASGWKVNGDVGLCPEDQAEGWDLPEGATLPFRRGHARGR